MNTINLQTTISEYFDFFSNLSINNIVLWYIVAFFFISVILKILKIKFDFTSGVKFNKRILSGFIIIYIIGIFINFSKYITGNFIFFNFLSTNTTTPNILAYSMTIAVVYLFNKSIDKMHNLFLEKDAIYHGKKFKQEKNKTTQFHNDAHYVFKEEEINKSIKERFINLEYLRKTITIILISIIISSVELYKQENIGTLIIFLLCIVIPFLFQQKNIFLSFKQGISFNVNHLKAQPKDS